MEDEKMKKIYKILDNIPVTDENEELIEDIRNEMYKNSISTFDNYSVYIYPVYSYNFLGET